MCVIPWVCMNSLSILNQGHRVALGWLWLGPGVRALCCHCFNRSLHGNCAPSCCNQPPRKKKGQQCLGTDKASLVLVLCQGLRLLIHLGKGQASRWSALNTWVLTTGSFNPESWWDPKTCIFTLHWEIQRMKAESWCHRHQFNLKYLLCECLGYIVTAWWLWIEVILYQHDHSEFGFDHLGYEACEGDFDTLTPAV